MTGPSQDVRLSADLGRAILDSVFAHVAVLDAAGRIVATNAAWDRFAREHGLERGWRGVDYLAPLRASTDAGDAEAARLLAELEDVLAGRREECRAEYDGLPSGVGTSFVMTAVPLRVPEGGAIVSHLDVSDHQRVTEELRDKEARLAAIVENAADGIVTIDERGIVDSFNPAAERMFGYRAEEVLGRNVSLLMPSQYAEEHDDYIRRYLVTGQRRIIGIGREVIGRRKNGTTFPVDLGVSEIQDGQRRFTGILRDLTERKRLEEEFLQAQKMEAVGRLAGGIAHDFNNLLAGVIGCCRIAAKTLAAGTPAREQVDEIRAAAERGAAMSRQLLAFSRKRPVQPQPMELNVVVSDREQMIRQLVGEDIRVDVVPSESGGPIVADPGQVEQILLNLVVNAREAMPSGGVLRIEVSDVFVDEKRSIWAPGFHAGPYVLLRVSDTGVGMSREVRDRIFEPFFTTKGPGEGTGLGLSTVYAIVQQLEGHIQVYSEPGCGTTFRLYFPADAGRVERLEPEMRDERGSTGGKETILVVEDDRLVRAGLRIELADLGYEVLAAGDADEALRLCMERAGPIDLVLSDIVMPGRSGPELVRELRTRKPDLAALFMSAFPAEVLLEQGRIQPGDPTIEKPFAIEDLAARLRALLDG